MKPIKFSFSFLFFFAGAVLLAQAPSYYDLAFQADSVTHPFKASNSNYVLVKSKRGSNGLNTTNSADSIKSFNIASIALVFSEESTDDIATREEYNQERWENLLMTYPEFFQAKTTYKNVCQCSAEASGDDYKTAQGFYIYFVPKGKPAAQAAPKAEPPVQKSNTSPTETKKEQGVTRTETPAETKPAANKVEEPKAPEVKKEEPKQAEVIETKTEEVAAAPEPSTKKKAAAEVNKPKRSKDAKACRMACYGYGDDDLNSFFKDNMVLSKKQKKKWKTHTAELKLQLHFDGSIKKSMVAGANSDLNKLVLDAVKGMNNWNSSVKNGLAIKSEVRITLKFDKETKSFKPAEIVVSPKQNVKCKCSTDSEMFGE